MLCNDLFVKKLKSNEDSQRVTEGNVKCDPTHCYKQNHITHREGFWEPSFQLGLGLENAWEYCDEPWLLHNVERVYIFGGVGVIDDNVPLLGLVIHHCNHISWNIHLIFEALRAGALSFMYHRCCKSILLMFTTYIFVHMY